MHRIDGGTAKEEYSFGEYRSGATLGVYKDKIYFNGLKYSWIVQRKFRYDPDTRKIKKNIVFYRIIKDIFPHYRRKDRAEEK